MAFRDCLKSPSVKQIRTGEYNGTPGSTIVVQAKDDFRVSKVKVSIKSAPGVLIEERPASLQTMDRTLWTYTATQANASLAGCIISATAFDIPGNTGTKEVTVDSSTTHSANSSPDSQPPL